MGFHTALARPRPARGARSADSNGATLQRSSGMVVPPHTRRVGRWPFGYEKATLRPTLSLAEMRSSSLLRMLMTVSTATSDGKMLAIPRSRLHVDHENC